MGRSGPSASQAREVSTAGRRIGTRLSSTRDSLQKGPLMRLAGLNSHSSYDNYELVATNGGTPYSEFRSNASAAKGGTYERMFHYYNYNRDGSWPTTTSGRTSRRPSRHGEVRRPPDVEDGRGDGQRARPRSSATTSAASSSRPTN